jgi:formate/nitrite transporter
MMVEGIELKETVTKESVEAPLSVSAYDEHRYHALYPAMRMYLTPTEIYAKIVHIGEEKARMSWWKTLILSIIGGSVIGLGAGTAYYVGGNLKEAPLVSDFPSDENYGYFKLIFGAFGYPFGFTALVICGGDLFTSYCMYTAAAWLEGKLSARDALQILLITWVGNFLGTVYMAWLFHVGDVYYGHDTTIVHSTEVKLNLSWRILIVRGMLGNLMVAIATSLQASALDVSGKILAIFLPIMAFGALGFEHCIANMFILTLGCLQGADGCSAHSYFVHNLFGVTIGNWMGSVFLFTIPLGIVLASPIPSFIGYGKGHLMADINRIHNFGAQADDNASPPDITATDGTRPQHNKATTTEAAVRS